VAQQLRDPDAGDGSSPDIPFVDHEAVRETVRLHRARRKARIEHRRRTRRAGIRFWLVLTLLLLASVVLSVTVWHEIQRLFGL
jgi:predicted nucleic acid-binding Zn ribbon protein